MIPGLLPLYRMIWRQEQNSSTPPAEKHYHALTQDCSEKSSHFADILCVIHYFISRLEWNRHAVFSLNISPLCAGFDYSSWRLIDSRRKMGKNPKCLTFISFWEAFGKKVFAVENLAHCCVFLTGFWRKLVHWQQLHTLLVESRSVRYKSQDANVYQCDLCD